MSGSGTETRKLTAQVLMRTDPILKRRIVLTAATAGTEPLSAAAWLRELADRHALALPWTDQPAYVPLTKPRCYEPPPPAHMTTLRQILGLSLKFKGLIKMTARPLRERHDEEALDAINDIDRAVNRLQLDVLNRLDDTGRRCADPEMVERVARSIRRLGSVYKFLVERLGTEHRCAALMDLRRVPATIDRLGGYVIAAARRR